jgi:hypothetical protein
MSKEINFDEVVEGLRKQGIPAYVESTGGHVATIYAGEQFDREEPLFVWRDGVRTQVGTQTWKRFPAIAGPGWFAGPTYETDPRGTTDEFAIGLDDDGESEYTDIDDSWTTDDIVREIAKVVVKASESR